MDPQMMSDEMKESLHAMANSAPLLQSTFTHTSHWTSVFRGSQSTYSLDEHLQWS